MVPVPPLETGTKPVEVKFLLASVKTKLEAVKVATLTLPEVMDRPEKLGEAVVCTSWLMLEVPLTVKVLEPRFKVPVPACRVLPLIVVAVSWVMVVVARVEEAVRDNPVVGLKVNRAEPFRVLLPVK